MYLSREFENDDLTRRFNIYNLMLKFPLDKLIKRSHLNLSHDYFIKTCKCNDSSNRDV